MDNNEKARRVIEASHKLEAEYVGEGKPELAQRVRSGFDELPVGSLARLYDILANVNA
jgi:hypothetical protein